MKALSLHIGINKYNHKGVTIPDLFCCHNDVNDLEAIALNKGFITTKLLDEQATYSNITNTLEKFAKQLENGDIFWLTYSGHGTQIPDLSSDESEKKDEAFVLYDRLFLDDEFNSYLAKFSEGVKIVVIVDACHSGTIHRGMKKVPRFVPSKIWTDSTFKKEIIKEEIKASGILLSACQDKEVAFENDKNGLFTSVLKTLLTTSEIRLTPKKLVELVATKLKDKQKPKYSVFGQNTASFTRQSLNKVYPSLITENSEKEIETKNNENEIDFLVKELKNISLAINSFINTLETLVK